MSKPWRRGGKYPEVSYRQMIDLTGTSPYVCTYDLRDAWVRFQRTVGATSKVCTKEGTIPAYYSMVEEVLWLHDHGYTISWETLPIAVLTIGTPPNWEFVSVL